LAVDEDQLFEGRHVRLRVIPQLQPNILCCQELGRLVRGPLHLALPLPLFLPLLLLPLLHLLRLLCLLRACHAEVLDAGCSVQQLDSQAQLTLRDILHVPAM